MKGEPSNPARDSNAKSRRFNEAALADHYFNTIKAADLSDGTNSCAGEKVFVVNRL